MLIVPNHVRDAINAKLDAAIAEQPEAEKDREVLYGQSLDHVNRYGVIPEFTLAKFTEDSDMTLLELAERCEKATGPGRELDADIALTQGWVELPGDNWIGPLAQIVVPDYTASLDAALTLVPEGWVVSLNTFEGGRADAYAMNARDEIVRPATRYIATPALALCAAALRALVKMESPDES